MAEPPGTDWIEARLVAARPRAGVLLDRLGRREDAREAFGRAIARANTPAEAAHIRQHLDRLSTDP